MDRPLNAKKYFIEPNTLYGKYKTIKEIVVPNGNKGIQRKWECLNVNNGNIVYHVGSYLFKHKNDKTQNEINKELLNNNKHQLSYRKYLYNTYKKRANRKNITFNLTFEEFDCLIQKQCYYCNNEPQFPSEKTIKERGNINEPNFAHNGIDRLDSNKGYTKENCVPCCPKCNMMKWVLNETEFFTQIIKIKENIKNIKKCLKMD